MAHDRAVIASLLRPGSTSAREPAVGVAAEYAVMNRLYFSGDCIGKASKTRRAVGDAVPIWLGNCDAPGRNRTCDPLLRRQVLYPLSYEGVEAPPT
jgi:hypothetical protein